jgi:hypothetical protein|tara:strand:- start:84 stop:449 length:366 start_codon:yes stop_codon:yes gene_type:complete
MVINPFYDTIIAVALVCTSFKVLIDKCLCRAKNKIFVSEDDVLNNKKSIKKNTKSFNKLNFIELKELESCPEDPIKLSGTCYQCQYKFKNYNYEPYYFAYDKRYCKFCWSSLHKKIFNNRL